MNYGQDFDKFRQSQGISGVASHQFTSMVNSAYINPSILEERQLNVTQMDVFSRLMMDRIIFLGTGIDDGVANIINAQLLYLQSVDAEKDISMYINSPGGGIYAGLSIYDTMNLITPDVSTMVTGMGASMGLILATAGEKGKRTALPHSRLMLHQPLGGAQGQATDMEITVKEIKKLKVELYNIVSEQTGQTFKRIEKDGDRDCWMTAAESVEYGLIDKVVTKTK